MDKRTLKKLNSIDAHGYHLAALQTIALDIYNAGMPAENAAKFAPIIYGLAAIGAGDNAEKLAIRSDGRHGGHAGHVMYVYKNTAETTERVRRALHSFADRHA